MSIHARICVAALLFAHAAPAAAESEAVKACLDLFSSSEQKQCAEALYRAASVELDQALLRVIERVSQADRRAVDSNASDPASWAAAVRKSQSSWQAYRDAERWGVVGHGGGSGRMTWVWGCLAEKTLERAGELKTPFYQR